MGNGKITVLASRFKMLVYLSATALAIGACLSACSPASGSITTSQEGVAIYPAFDENYESIESAVKEKASDARLVAVRLSAGATADSSPGWMYLFASRTRVCTYTAFISDGKATVEEYAQMSYSEEDMASIPDTSEIAVDANEAFSIALSVLDRSQKVESAEAYLMTYVVEDDDPYEYAMKWFFLFNDSASEAKPDSDENAVDSPTASQDKEASAKPFAYYVDARTGEVQPVLMNSE